MSDNKELEKIKHILDEINSKDEKTAFVAGYNCSIYGANTKNCHYSLFASPELTKAWESGKEQAEMEKE